MEHRCLTHELALLAVADECGRLLAASCARPDPSEIAAVAPIMDPTGSGRSARMFGRQVWIQKVRGPSGALFLCAVGETACARACVAELGSALWRILSG